MLLFPLRVLNLMLFSITLIILSLLRIFLKTDSKFSSVVKRSIHQRSVLCILVFQLFAFVIYRFRI